MSRTNFSGRVNLGNGGEINAPIAAGVPTAGLAGSMAQVNTVASAIADNAATRLFQVTVPNAGNAACIEITVLSTITAVGHVGDSARVVKYFVVVSRVAGSVAVIAISAAVGAQIATSGSSTLTSTLTVSAVTGGATASNTFLINVTNVGTPAGISQTQGLATILNYQGTEALYPGGVNAPGVTLTA